VNPHGEDAPPVAGGPYGEDEAERVDQSQGGGAPDDRGDGGVDRGDGGVDSGDGGVDSGDGGDDGGGGDGGDGTLTRVSITVDEEHVASLPRVVEALRERGMQVDAVLEGLGMVTGSARDADSLRTVEGVSAVDPQLEHRLPPPEDDIQ
jgi:hypothetical protein